MMRLDATPPVQAASLGSFLKKYAVIGKKVQITPTVTQMGAAAAALSGTHVRITGQGPTSGQF